MRKICDYLTSVYIPKLYAYTIHHVRALDTDNYLVILTNYSQRKYKHKFT